jgi:hypothetical protein
MEKLEAMTSATNSSIRKILYDISKDPNHAFADLYDRFELKEKEAERYKDIVVKLIGAPDFLATSFPSLRTCHSAGPDGKKLWKISA